MAEGPSAAERDAELCLPPCRTTAGTPNGISWDDSAHTWSCPLAQAHKLQGFVLASGVAAGDGLATMKVQSSVPCTMAANGFPRAMAPKDSPSPKLRQQFHSCAGSTTARVNGLLIPGSSFMIGDHSLRAGVGLGVIAHPIASPDVSLCTEQMQAVLVDEGQPDV